MMLYDMQGSKNYYVREGWCLSENEVFLETHDCNMPDMPAPGGRPIAAGAMWRWAAQAACGQGGCLGL